MFRFSVPGSLRRVPANSTWRPLIGDFDGPDDDDSQPNGQLSPAEIVAYFFA
ncbi:MAG: hypothetical protein GY788_10145 [bacterium]|nr:hypothetical protein [bacterium]